MSEILEQLDAALGDRYTIERRLGEGAMATVYLAADLKLDRKVAIKVLKPELAAALGTDRFLQEIKTTASLQHPHILPLFDSGKAGGFLYYVMPYVEGETLRDRLEREQRLGVAQAVEIAADVADALEYAHQQGVIHRDIKPENVLLHGGRPLVADFGIALALDAAGGDRLTATGIAVGTPGYMSPEQATASPDADHRTDIYALGCMLYEMLAGTPPFTGPNVASVVRQHVVAVPPDVTRVRPQVPDLVTRTLSRAMAKAPTDRFASAGQLAEALVAAGLESRSRRPLGRGRRAWWLTSAAAAVALVTIAVAVFLARLRERSAVAPDAASIAVMPLVPVTPDTALTRLGRELVVTLSTNLDGVGEIRTIEALTVLAQAPERNVISHERAAAMARRLGARSVVHGSLLSTGGEVRVDVGLYNTRTEAELARATVSGDPDSVAALSNDLTFALLEQIWRRGEVPVPSLEALTTRSLPALRAYLDGERALAASEMDEAVAAFDAAFAEDSTFWFALWRSVYPRVYEGARLDSVTLAALLEHRDELPEPDRLLVQADLAPTMSEQTAQIREVTRRFPTYWPGWFDYADQLVHWTPYLGTSHADARAALERAVELNPGFTSAWTHLFWMTAYARDTMAMDEAAQRLEEYTSPTGYKINPDLLRYYGAIRELVAGGGVFDSTSLETNVEYVYTYRGPIPPLEFGIGFLRYGFPRAQVQLADAVLRLGPRREVAAALWFGKALAFAARGGWDSSLVALDRWTPLTDDSTAALVGYGLGVLGVALGSVHPDAVASLRARVAGDGLSTAEEHGGVAWLDGIVAYASGNRTALAAAREALSQSGTPFVGMLDGSLAAFDTALAGDHEAAGRALAELTWENAERYRHNAYGSHHPFFDAITRLAASDWLREAGDLEQALRLLSWHDAVFWQLQGLLAFANRVAAPVADYRRAELEEELARPVAAERHYRSFVSQYDLGEEERAPTRTLP